MEFVISGKERELKFGIGFVRKLDENYTASHDGLEFGMGLMGSMMQLRLKNPTVLTNIIHAAVVGNVTQRQVDVAIEEYADENDGLGQLYEDLEEEMGKSSVVKDSLNNLEKLEAEQID